MKITESFFIRFQSQPVSSPSSSPSFKWIEPKWIEWSSPYSFLPSSPVRKDPEFLACSPFSGVVHSSPWFGWLSDSWDGCGLVGGERIRAFWLISQSYCGFWIWNGLVENRINKSILAKSLVCKGSQGIPARHDMHLLLYLIPFSSITGQCFQYPSLCVMIGHEDCDADNEFRRR